MNKKRKKAVATPKPGIITEFRDTLRKAVLVSVVAGILGLVPWFMDGKPTFAQVHRRLEAYRAMGQPSDTLFRVLVADLQGDDEDGSKTIALAENVELDRGLEPVLIARTLRPVAGGSIPRQRERLEKKARKLLQRWDAQLLIFGRIDGDSLSLTFIAPDGPTGTSEAYRLSEDVQLSGLDRDLSRQLQAVALSLIRAEAEASEPILESELENVAMSLSRLLPDSTETSARNREGIAYAYGLAALKLGEQTGEVIWYQKATAAFRSAARGREPGSSEWGASQHGLGRALRNVGTEEADTSKLREAVDAYRAALTARESNPVERAATLNNLGVALRALGELRSDPDLLRGAIAAYTDSVHEVRRESAPLAWAATQNNLGVALVALGELTGDPQHLESAIAAYRRALRVRTRGAAPSAWARTQQNMAIPLRQLAEIKGDPALAEKAVATYQAALEEQSQPSSRARIQHNMAFALQTLGELRRDSAFFLQAESLYDEALAVRTRGRASQQWASSWSDRCRNRRLLGEMQGSRERLMQAIQACDQALEVYGPDGNLRQWAQTHNQRGYALRVLGILERNPARIQDALTAYDAVLSAQPGDDVLLWREIRENRDAARAELADLLQK